VAWACDGILFAAPTLAVAWFVGGDRLYRIGSNLMLHKSMPRIDIGPFASPGSALTPSARHLALQAAVMALVLLAGVTLWVLYRIGLTAWSGATVGKWACGIRVVRAEDLGRPPSLRRSFTRWMVPQAAGLLPLPGTGIVPYLLLIRDRDCQGAHDKAARTLVIRHRRPVLGGGADRCRVVSGSSAQSTAEAALRSNDDSRVPGFA
jgi:uncharacterized RDD family membrane protein YckC